MLNSWEYLHNIDFTTSPISFNQKIVCSLASFVPSIQSWLQNKLSIKLGMLSKNNTENTEWQNTYNSRNVHNFNYQGKNSHKEAFVIPVLQLQTLSIHLLFAYQRHYPFASFYLISFMKIVILLSHKKLANIFSNHIAPVNKKTYSQCQNQRSHT